MNTDGNFICIVGCPPCFTSYKNWKFPDVVNSFWEWQREARSHQSRFRETVLNVDCAPNPGRSDIPHYYGNIISQEDAARGLNFFPPFRDEIRNEIGKTDKAICTNLLRSEHIPYNIFFPMKKNLDSVKI